MNRYTRLVWICGLLIMPLAANAGDTSPPSLQASIAAAEKGDVNAQLALAARYDRGDGVPKDEVQGFKWLLRAAQSGHPEAQFLVANSYKIGQGVPQSDAEALKWKQKAAENGHVLAQVGLGYDYAHGLGVRRDNAEAALWFRKAAEKGDASAQNFLGEAYALGKGVERDDTKAVKWYGAAAAQGLSIAQFNLGTLYARSDARVPQDAVLAYMWLDMAAKQGDGAAALTQTAIVKTMSSEERKKAEALSRACLAAKYKDCGKKK